MRSCLCVPACLVAAMEGKDSRRSVAQLRKLSLSGSEVERQSRHLGAKLPLLTPPP